MKHRVVFCSCLVFAVLLAACRAPATSHPAAETIAVASTASPLPTRTREPVSATPEELPTIRPLPEPVFSTEEAWKNLLDVTQQAEYTSWAVTAQANAALATQFPQTCYGNQNRLSLDGNWLAANCDTEKQIRIASRDGSKLWTVDYDTLFQPSEDFETSIVLWVDHWTNNGRYVYIGWRLCCWDPGGLVYYSPQNVERFDTVTGELSFVISGNMSYSFSPDDHWLIEIQQPVSPLILQVHDLVTEKITTLTLALPSQYEQAGLIAWSPDSSRFVLVAGYGTDIMDFTQAMILVDAGDLSQKVLLEDFRDDIREVEWAGEDILTYITTDYSGNVPVITPRRRDLNTLEFLEPLP